MPNHRHDMITREATRILILSGFAIFTVVSKKTGKRITFKVAKAKAKKGYNNEGTFWVSRLSGPDNMSDYTPLGMIANSDIFRSTRNSPPANDPGVVAFKWLWTVVQVDGVLPTNVEVWFEGRCCKCGRRLTVPSSINRYMGPECASKAGASDTLDAFTAEELGVF